MSFIISSSSSYATTVGNTTVRQKEMVISRSITDHSSATKAINDSHSILVMGNHDYSTVSVGEGLDTPSSFSVEMAQNTSKQMVPYNMVLQEGSAVETEEEEDTEDEDEDDDDLLVSIFSAFNVKMKEQSTRPPTFAAAAVLAPTADDDASARLFAAPASASNNNNNNNNKNNNNNQVQKKPAAAAALSCSLSLSTIQTYSPQLNFGSLDSPLITTFASRSDSNNNNIFPPSCCFESSTTNNNNNNKRVLTTGSYTTSPSNSSTKMDIKSPPQPRPSSRFLNAFQRFRINTTTSTTKSSSSYNIAPAIKSSLADRIKYKLLLQHNNNNRKDDNKTQPPTIISRSASLSSIWTRSVVSPVVMATPPMKKSSEEASYNNNCKMPHSMSVTSFQYSKKNATSYAEEFTTPPPLPPAAAALSLTKSISSHRLYTNKTKDKSSTTTTRPKRHPLRAVNLTVPHEQQQHNNNKQQQVKFIKVVNIRETWSKHDYDRGSDPEAVCSKLTPLMAQYIKQELNAYKLHEMQVHELSRVYTHFFF